MLPGLGYNLIPGPAGLRPQDVFAATLYTGNGTGQTITTGIDLLNGGGLAWIKERSSGGQSHQLYDTVRGPENNIRSNLTIAEVGSSTGLTSFLSTGFVVGSNGSINASGNPGVVWSFRRAPKFFDVVTYTGNGATERLIPHSLGIAPGMVIIKRTDDVTNWVVGHRSLTDTSYQMYLNLMNGQSAIGDLSGSGATPNTSTHFVVSAGPNANNSGATYVAYLFAHDAAADGLVQCGTYTGNGFTNGPTITLDWQPQFLMVKRTDAAGDWWMYDATRSTSNPRILKLLANSGDDEDTTGEDMDFLTTGFQPATTATGLNASGGTYIYLAIRAPI